MRLNFHRHCEGGTPEATSMTSDCHTRSSLAMTLVFMVVVSLLFSACNTQPEQKPIDPTKYKKPLEEANKVLTETEA